MNNIQMKELIREAKKGNADAFGQIYAVYAGELYKFALWYLKNPQDAEDAVQEACILAFTRLRSLKKPEAFKSWFFKILANEAKKLLAKRTVLLRNTTEEIPVHAGFYHSDFDSRMEVKELFDAIDDEDRLIVLLSVLQGYSSKEISMITGLNSSTVRSRLSRTLAKLRKEAER